MADGVVETDRLILRRWRVSDREPFAQMNADPRVMEYFSHTLSVAESGVLADRCEGHWAERDFGPFAIELREYREFIGFVGLFVPSFDAHFTPCVEIGWRLAHAYWGKGFATEAALASLQYGFGHIGLKEIVSFTTAANTRSRHVMEKLGMTYSSNDDFAHPGLAADHPLSPHVLYRVTPALAAAQVHPAIPRS